MITELTTGLLIGLVGSLHCFGMCGPIAVALPIYKSAGLKFFLGRFLYNVGRVVTYVSLGAMAGLIGERFAVAGLQQEVAIVVGSLMLLTAIVPRVMNRVWNKFLFTQSATTFVKRTFAAQFQRRTLASLFALGLINGFLPCGLVYMAMAGSAAAGSVAGGAALMAGFGAGTVPVLFGISIAGSLLPADTRRSLSRWAPLFVGALGLLLILRGLNLGIPMVSPKAPAIGTASQTPPCCSPS
ncbi:MAG TPA: sulfite exporter TauE/SafE family protein [Bacteroidota bacterium]|nr:sulfite exporter TauE/SafE family protein [Bacteroidota bacterium]